MTRGEALFAHLSTCLVSGSGLALGWMAYFVKPEDIYAVVNHPWQSEALHLHILFAPLLVFSCGQVWRDHVWRRVRGGYPERRRTGLMLFVIVLPMIASGYFIQIAEGVGTRSAAVGIHVTTSVLWILIYIIHQLTPRTGRTVPHTD